MLQAEGFEQAPILIIDFGSQYTQLIARRVRELHVYCVMLPYDAQETALAATKAQGVILSGGPESVTAKDSPTIPACIFDWNVPILGICYGMQALATHFGGEVLHADKQEFGYAQLEVMHSSDLFEHLKNKTLLDVWMSHGDHVTQLPTDFITIAKTDGTPIAAMAHRDKPIFAVQFHPEVTHTVEGQALLSAFVRDICGLSPAWTAEHIIDVQIQAVRKQVGADRVLLGLSGGVDSAVVAALLEKAIGKQLTAIFIDTGLLRLNEATQVLETFQSHATIELIHVQAEEIFLSALKGVTDPEEKRKICGRLFIELFEAQLKKFPDAKYLAQGTIYPDVVESAKTVHGKAHVIKSHHNVGGLPDRLQLKLVEPLRQLFKDEVRELGKKLGLSEALVMRHPFPGPGLALRIVGEVTKACADTLRQVDAIFIDALRRHGLYAKVSQAFAVLLPVNSVGVVGDTRRYASVVALRAVESTDFMTATWAPLPWDFLAAVSNQIVNEIEAVSRVVYDISSKPPATIEWE
jgi:GMP synthase (glutamine-hydrolysing)